MSSTAKRSVTADGIVIVDPPSLREISSGESPGSFGAGTLEILQVIQLLSKFGIPSCMVGVGALRYYGAHRVVHMWEICVPSEQIQRAIEILQSPSNEQVYEPCPHIDRQAYSLHHTFPFFKIKGFWIRFYLVPSDDAHIDCSYDNFEYSKMGLPYPKLKIFAQSLLDTLSDVPLTDLVDGMDLDHAWGDKNLDLNGPQDIAYAVKKNAALQAAAPGTIWELRSEPFDRREFWEEIVATKTTRIGPEFPPGTLATRFRFPGSCDPRLLNRTIV